MCDPGPSQAPYIINKPPKVNNWYSAGGPEFFYIEHHRHILIITS
jgi:hypothetical protein